MRSPISRFDGKKVENAIEYAVAESHFTAGDTAATQTIVTASDKNLFARVRPRRSKRRDWMTIIWDRTLIEQMREQIKTSVESPEIVVKCRSKQSQNWGGRQEFEQGAGHFVAQFFDSRIVLMNSSQMNSNFFYLGLCSTDIVQIRSQIKSS